VTADQEEIYLDYNASAPLAPVCADAALEYLDGRHGNPSSRHGAGERARRTLDEARTRVARLLNAQPAEIVFTSGGTEGNHTAVLGALALAPDRNHIITSAVEHPSSLLLFKHLESRGTRVTYLPVDGKGRLDLRQLEEAIGDDTALVSLMWANNETGVLFPVADIGRLVKSRGILFHSDAVQAAGKLPVDIKDTPIDLLTLSGHKLHAPPGVGALYVRKGIKIPPLLFGHQERNRRGGTENMPGIVALGVAALLAMDSMQTDTTRIAALRDRLERGITDRFQFATVNGGGAERVVNTANIRFGELNAEAIVHKLDRKGVYVSQGAACSAGGSEPSHVLTAMGLSREAASASVRFSLGRETEARQIARVLELLAEIIASGVADAA